MKIFNSNDAFDRKQVILDRDVAELFNCKNGTKTIN